MRPQSNPLVSVCIPAFRGEAFIAEAIQSVLDQTWDGLELIVIDDNSPDGTCDVVRRFTDPRLRLLSNPINLGAEGNWNRCLEEARGKYIKLLPQDDKLSADCLRKQVAALEADTQEALSFCFAARKIVSPRGRVLFQRAYPSKQSRRVAAEELMRSTLRAGGNLIGEPGSVLFRRSSADRAGIFDGSNPYVIDLDYWLRLLHFGDAFYIAEPLSMFRISKGSWSVAIGRQQVEHFVALLERTARRCPEVLKPQDVLLGRLAARTSMFGRRCIYRFLLR